MPNTPKHMQPRSTDAAPQSFETDNDKTIASPALGYGMERRDMIEEQLIGEPISTPEKPPIIPSDQAMPEPDPLLPTIGPESAPNPLRKPITANKPLSRFEVAAVSEDRSYYVQDSATPYLSSAQAEEDVQQTRRRHRRMRIALVSILSVIALGVGAWAIWQNLPRVVTQTQTLKYKTATIIKEEFLDTYETTAATQAADERSVSPEVSGTIASVNWENGDDIEEGYVVFRLESPTIEDALNRAQNAYDAAQADVESRNQTLDNARDKLAREQETVDKLKSSEGAEQTTANQAAISAAQAVVDDARNAVEEAETHLRDAEQVRDAVRETYDLAVEQEDKLRVYAPISGTITGLDTNEVQVGKTVTTGMQLCSIVDTSSLVIEVDIPEDERGDIEEGLEVRLTFPDAPDVGTIQTEVESVEERDDGERVVAIIRINDPDERITPNMSVHVVFVKKSITDALIVPKEAVNTDDDDQTYLNVLLDPTRDIVTKVPVEVVARNKTQAAIEAENVQKDNTVIIGDVTEQKAEEQAKEG